MKQKCPHCGSPAPALSTICKSCGSIINTSKVVNSYEESVDELHRMTEEVPDTLKHPYPAGKRMVWLLLDVATLGIAWLARTGIREKQKQSLTKKQAAYEERTRLIREKYRGKAEITTLSRDLFNVIVHTTQTRNAITLRNTLTRVAAIACILLMIMGSSMRDKRKTNAYFSEIASALADKDMGTAKAIIGEMNEDGKLPEEVKQQANSRMAELDLQRQLAGYDVDFDRGFDEIDTRLNRVKYAFHRDILQGDINRMKYETGMYEGWPSEVLAGIKEISGAGPTLNRRNDRMQIMEALMRANPDKAKPFVRYTVKKDDKGDETYKPKEGYWNMHLRCERMMR